MGGGEENSWRDIMHYSVCRGPPAKVVYGNTAAVHRWQLTHPVQRRQQLMKLLPHQQMGATHSNWTMRLLASSSFYDFKPTLTPHFEACTVSRASQTHFKPVVTLAA